MPTNEYRCDKCKKTFRRTESISRQKTGKQRCPKCGSRKVSWVPGRVHVITAKKS